MMTPRPLQEQSCGRHVKSGPQVGPEWAKMAEFPGTSIRARKSSPRSMSEDDLLGGADRYYESSLQ